MTLKCMKCAIFLVSLLLSRWPLSSTGVEDKMYSKVCLNHCQFEVWKNLCRGSEPKAATVADGGSGLRRDKLSCKTMLASRGVKKRSCVRFG